MKIVPCLVQYAVHYMWMISNSFHFVALGDCLVCFGVSGQYVDITNILTYLLNGAGPGVTVLTIDGGTSSYSTKLTLQHLCISILQGKITS